MNRQAVSSQPRRTARTLARLGGLAVCLAAAIGLAPAAWATSPPPEPSFAPVPPLPPPAAAPAHFPPWTVAALLAAIIVLSVATTLITLALEYTRQARREEKAATEPQPSQRTNPFHPLGLLDRRGRDLQQSPSTRSCMTHQDMRPLDD